MPQHEDEPADPPSLATGACVAGRYLVEGRIGVGGMGIVLRARDLRLGHAVALKVLRRSQRGSDATAARFLREARVVAQLRSDHVVRVLDVDTASDPPYLAMELLDGQDVALLLRARGAFPVDLALQLVVQAARGVAEAHANGVVHRDLKPSNLLVARGPDGTQRVKVIDFGISKPLVPDDATPDLTSSGQLLGSPRYMSPEQVRGTSAIDARSDVWALGAILYELIAGVAPFDAATVADTLARIVGEAPRPLRDRVPDVPERVDAIVTMCLQKDAALRTQTVSALLEELESIAPAGPLRVDAALGAAVERAPSETTAHARDRVWSVPRPSPRGPARTGRRRAAIAAGLLAVLAAGAWSLLRTRVPSARPEVTSATPSVATAAPPSPPAPPVSLERPPLAAPVASAPTPSPAAPTALRARGSLAHPAPVASKPLASTTAPDEVLELGRRK